LEEKSSADAGVLEIFPEPYAPPRGTGHAGRRHLRKPELETLRELLEIIGF